ncbi:unnamed protein product [Orchesella dallaii]|uniref:Fibroblast growth factor 17 n=1 Tax=Orchesella dallaii TaxID=48710 RepID=A0ABP1Q0E7_9HEXA
MNIDKKFLLVCLQLIIFLVMSMVVEGRSAPVSGSYNTSTISIPTNTLTKATKFPKVIKRAYRLYNFCSDKHVAIRNSSGAAVSANASKDDQNGELVLETMLRNETLKIRIRGFYSNKYMCYNRKGRLVAKPKAKRDMCEFIEEQREGHFIYKSAFFGGFVLGFNRRGKPLNGIKHIEPVYEDCSKFLKLDSNLNDHDLTRNAYDIETHNRRVGQTHATQKHKHRHGKKSHPRFQNITSDR